MQTRIHLTAVGNCSVSIIQFHRPISRNPILHCQQINHNFGRIPPNMIQIKVTIECIKFMPAFSKIIVVAAKHGMEVWQAYKVTSQQQQRLIGRFQAGAFQEKMSRKEAALILGVSESAVEKKIKEAHRRAMVANHLVTGGSTYLATKINEAKDIMMGKN